MTTKYQRAVIKMKQGKTWQEVADELGGAIGEKMHRSNPWNVAHGKSRSKKVEEALEELGLVESKKRYRLAAEFNSEEERELFKDQFGIGGHYTFTQWAHDQWADVTTSRRIFEKIWQKKNNATPVVDE